MLENVINLVVLIISTICGIDVFKDFLKMLCQSIKHSHDSESTIRLPDGRRYDRYEPKVFLYMLIESVVVSLYLLTLSSIIFCFFGLSDYLPCIPILVDKALSIICPFSIVSFVSSFKKKVYDKVISIDTILKTNAQPDTIKGFLILNKRLLTLEEIKELDEHFYHSKTIDWVNKNGFILVNRELCTMHM